MADNVIYWLWLQDCLGPSAKVKDLFTRYKDAKEFFLAGKDAWKNEKFTPAVFGRLKRRKPESYRERTAFCAEHKIYILCPDDEYYPDRLLEIENYPLALYVRGDYKVLNSDKSLAVIGSRTPGVYGKRAAETIFSAALLP